ncbi:MurR/RpiR family transcriptional regulator [Halomonas dongshanensis]|uniref:MurR/RpiR family transcriptional regulator n=1 Tax=Halomonas dongshanensis TaxID=2890835 RepID=A0ABT2EA64_9GAMM|nr:MurR/RpiR family transcriptional regulator [Halomonas dongshanensis]MCS2608468.1 MurR/RpiR family transcriptional regulator [Halomonas dongshanensis]
MPPGDPLREQLIAQFDGLSGQLQQAARYLLEHPNEVALVSMRELARHAGVQPATMTRLAKALGFEGYNALRARYAEALRHERDGFADKARRAGSSKIADGDERAANLLRKTSAQLLSLCDPEPLMQLNAMAKRLAKARKVYVVGLRSSHVVAWHFHYVMSLLGERSIHLDGPAGTGGDALMRATKNDVLLVVSIQPYTADSLVLAKRAADQGVTIVSITDSAVSPLAGISRHAVLCPTESDSFFHTLVPALALSEALCALLADTDRAATLDALQRADEHHAALNTYATLPPWRHC